MQSTTIEPMSITVRPNGSREYPVYAAGGWQALWNTEQLKSIRGKGRVFLITQSGLEESVLQPLLEAGLSEFFPEGVNDRHIVRIGQGEHNKHLNTIGPIYNHLIDCGIDRRSTLLALGGGVVGDLTGFVAATILRGVRFVQLPTTLLAAVDSSVGGKVAVNVDRGKNMVGAFYQPAFVYFNLQTLHTLPEREWDCGLAEMCKHALLESTGSILNYMRLHVTDLRNADAPALRQAVLDSAAFKASVVARDERESGLRAILNLGHTTAHAIESITGYRRFSHGEAVARGLATALILSRDILDYSRSDEMLAFMHELRLPMDTAELSGESLWEHMQYDKKAVQGVPEFVLLDQSATAVYGQKVTRDQFMNAWQEQRERCG